MRRIEYGAAFKKDHKRMAKRGAAMQKPNAVLGLLMNDTPLPAIARTCFQAIGGGFGNAT